MPTILRRSCRYIAAIGVAVACLVCIATFLSVSVRPSLLTAMGGGAIILIPFALGAGGTDARYAPTKGYRFWALSQRASFAAFLTLSAAWVCSAVIWGLDKDRISALSRRCSSLATLCLYLYVFGRLWFRVSPGNDAVGQTQPITARRRSWNPSSALAAATAVMIAICAGVPPNQGGLGNTVLTIAGFGMIAGMLALGITLLVRGFRGPP